MIRRWLIWRLLDVAGLLVLLQLLVRLLELYAWRELQRDLRSLGGLGAVARDVTR